jgi:hypothetical protein
MAYGHEEITMRYAEIAKEDEDVVVQMAKNRLNHSKVEQDKNQLRVKHAQERKLKKDIAAKQRPEFKESESDNSEPEKF